MVTHCTQSNVTCEAFRRDLQNRLVFPYTSQRFPAPFLETDMADVITRDVLAEMLKGWVEESGGDMPMVAAREEVRWFFDSLTEALTEGNEVRIHGFGTFLTAQRAARMGRNPRTGEAVKVAARRVVRFAPSTSLSDQLRGITKPSASKTSKKKS